MQLDARVSTAALNNAEWCDAVCRSHGVPTTRSDQFWATLRRAPNHYPDAVTLLPAIGPETFLPVLEHGRGASIKDSFADLDLAASGFRVLFEADWIFRDAGAIAARPPGWAVVGTADDLADWSVAAELEGLIRPELLARQEIRVLVGRDGEQITAGAIINRSADVVGVSNFFATTMDAVQAWNEVAAVATGCFPGLPLCGYEQPGDLPPALAAGFAPIGPLRVWIN